MKWCRFQTEQKASYGIIEDDSVIEVKGSPFEEYTVTDITYALGQVKLLAPLVPRMIYAAGPNHRGHVEGIAARKRVVPQYPVRPDAHFRSPSAVIGSEENVIVPEDCSGAVQPEGQLAVVIGRKAKKVSKEEALGCVFGYTCANDISQRVWQQSDRTFLRGKNCDTFNPIGPWIVTGLDPTKFRIIVRHNGEVWEDFSSADQIWDTATWIHELSKYSTLYPGDVLWMGTDGADGDMFPGDSIEVEISDIDILSNHIVAEG